MMLNVRWSEWSARGPRRKLDGGVTVAKKKAAKKAPAAKKVAKKKTAKKAKKMACSCK
jgi:hypothetical protein